MRVKCNVKTSETGFFNVIAIYKVNTSEGNIVKCKSDAM